MDDELETGQKIEGMGCWRLVHHPYQEGGP
jgi:hypothetical protein